MPTDNLTDRQRAVLELHNEGKSPTEIGQAIGVSSQGVHGHLRRLRDKGLVAPTKGKATANGRADVSVKGILSNVQASIDAERDALDSHESGVRQKITDLEVSIHACRGELAAVEEARTRLAELERQLTS